MKQIYFVSGLPRSGSTILMNLLGQNPNHYVTPTSGLIELFVAIHNSWHNFIEFKAEGLEKVKPRIRNVMKGVIECFFEKEFEEGKIVFDKSRGWLQFAEDLETTLERKVKMIVPIRDIRAILASFEKLYRKRDIDWRYPVGDEFLRAQTVVDRCELLLSPGGVVGIAINRVRDAMQRKSDSLLLIPYPSFTKNPKGVVDTIHELLELEPFDYNPKKVDQITHEDDNWHGMDLHVIRPEIKPQEELEPWEGILPDAYVKELENRYGDIQRLCAPQPPKSAS
jgi:sulfotransferase